MKKNITILGTLLFSSLAFSQVGINTDQPDNSAILEVSADAPPGSTDTTKKGLLLPRVSLNGSNDITTIPNPAKGLIVINTEDAGNYPNEVLANEYYYWDGLHWERLILKKVVDKAVKPRIYYIESSATQIIPPSDINFVNAGDFKYVVVTFTETPSVNIENIISLNPDSSFTVNVSGLFEFSSFINFNPMTNSGNAFLNFAVQTSTDDGATWNTSSALTRTAWGGSAATYLKTVTIQAFPLKLDKGTRFRLVFFSPFENGNFGGTGVNPYIGTTDHLPIAKGLRVQLLDFNL